ncbi:MAG: glycosyltransferase family 4 protein [Deferribacterales bacterium]
MKKIVFSTNSSFSLVKFRYGIMKRLCDMGHEVHAVIPVEGLEEELEKIGVKVHPLGMDSNGINPLKDIVYFIRLIIIFFKIKPNVVFNYTAKSTIYGTVAAKIAGSVSIPVLPGLGYSFSGRRLEYILRKMYSFAFMFADQVWFINNDDHKLFVSKNILPGNKKVLVLPGEGVNTTTFAPMEIPKHKPFTFLLIARLIWDKGVGEYAKAAAIIKKEIPDTRFTLIGQLAGNNPNAVDEASLNGWVSEGTIEYLGTFNDVRKYIAESECVVLPTYYREGKPMVLMEACSMAVPVIATRMVGCKDIVEDGKNGLMCDPKDVEGLVSAMKKMIAMTQDERKKMGMTGRRMILEQFDENIIIDIYLNEMRKMPNMNDF